jgi:hypothetical protein
MSGGKLSVKTVLLTTGISLAAAIFGGSLPASAQSYADNYSCPAGLIYDPSYGCTLSGYADEPYDYGYYGYAPYYRGYYEGRHHELGHGFAHGLGGSAHDLGGGLSHGIGVAHGGGAGFGHGMGGGFGHGGGGGHR